MADFHFLKQALMSLCHFVKFPTRDTDWTARGVKNAVEIRKTGAHAMNRDGGGGGHQLPLLYSKLL